MNENEILLAKVLIMMGAYYAASFAWGFGWWRHHPGWLPEWLAVVVWGIGMLLLMLIYLLCFNIFCSAPALRS